MFVERKKKLQIYLLDQSFKLRHLLYVTGFPSVLSCLDFPMCWCLFQWDKGAEERRGWCLRAPWPDRCAYVLCQKLRCSFSPLSDKFGEISSFYSTSFPQCSLTGFVSTKMFLRSLRKA